MLTAIPRHALRAHPTSGQIVASCRERGEFIQGPLVRDCIRGEVDVESFHADVCTCPDLFASERCASPGVDRAARAVQVPVHASLTDRPRRRVARVVRKALPRCLPPAPAASRTPTPPAATASPAGPSPASRP